MKSCKLIYKYLLTICLTIVCCANLTEAQQNKEGKEQEATKSPEYGVASVRLEMEMPDVGVNDRSIIVVLTNPTFTGNDIPADLGTGATFKFVKSNRTIPANMVKLNPTTARQFGGKTLEYILTKNASTTPTPEDDQIQVTFSKLTFVEDPFTREPPPPQPVENATRVGNIYTAGNIDELIADLREVLKNSVASSKTTEEKDIFAGLNIAVPSGGDGETEGNADIIFNRTIYGSDVGSMGLFDTLIFGFKLKKGTENRTDPRHFELGLNIRSTFLLGGRSTIVALRDALNNATPSTIRGGSVSFNENRDGRTVAVQGDPVALINKLQQKFFRAIFFDNAIRFEGDVKGTSIGNVSNLLYDGQVQVTTVSRPLIGNTGFWNFRLVPIGVEAGHNLTNNDMPDMEKRSLARLKAGAVLNLFYSSLNSKNFLSRIELEAQAVNRYLFKNETAFDEVAMKAVQIDKGNKYWLQADLKVLSNITAGKGKIGFRASFIRGFLPPIYAFTKTFKFGLVFESAEEDTSKDMKVQ